MLDLVGSRARGDNITNSDYDYTSNEDRDEIIKKFKKKGPLKILKNGEKYLKFEQNGKIYDIWISEHYLDRILYKSFRALRKIPKGVLISLKKEVKKNKLILGPYGVYQLHHPIISIFKYLDNIPELKKKYYKYLV